MPLPALLLPIAGGAAAAAAATAAGAGLSAHLAEKRVDAMLEKVRAINNRIALEKDKFEDERELLRMEFSERAVQYGQFLEELPNDSVPSHWEPEPWLVQRLADLTSQPAMKTLAPHFKIHKPSMELSPHQMYSVGRFFEQGARVEKTHPTLGKGMEVIAVAAVTAKYAETTVNYISSRIGYVIEADKFLAEACVYIDACERFILEYEQRFHEDVVENQIKVDKVDEMATEMRRLVDQTPYSSVNVENLRLIYKSSINLFLGLVECYS